MTRTKTATKTTPKPAPADFHANVTPAGVRKMRRLVPDCERLGTAIGADSPLSALLCFDERTRGPRRNHRPVWGRAFDQAVKAHRLDPMAPALKRLDEAHGADLCAVSDEAFLVGYFAGQRAAAVRR